MRRRIIEIIGVIFLSVLIALAAMTGCADRTIDARELVSVQIMGADGYGTINLETNREIVQSMVREKMDLVKEGDEKGLERAFVFEAALETLTYTADRVTGLKNGDAVEIRATFDEALAREAGIRFSNTSFTYTVGSLSQASKFVVGDNISLTYKGYNGVGTAEVKYSGEMEDFKNDFSVEFLTPSTRLSNGDVVRLHVVPDNDALTRVGRIADEVTLNFTVEGLPELETVDPFENLVLMYNGVSDHGTLTLDTTRLPADWVERKSSAVAPLRFMADPSEMLSNGDRVTIRCEVDDVWFAERGIKLYPLSKVFSVEGLKDYPRNLDNVDLMPLFKAIDAAMEKNIAFRLKQNLWNDDASAGEPLSVWDYKETHGVRRIFYGYRETDRSDNFVAILVKVQVEGTCVSASPYDSFATPGQHESSTLYLMYVVENIMYDRSSIDDYRSFGLKGHSDAEYKAVDLFREAWVQNDEDIRMVEAEVPSEVAWKDLTPAPSQSEPEESQEKPKEN